MGIAGGPAVQPMLNSMATVMSVSRQRSSSTDHLLCGYPPTRDRERVNRSVAPRNPSLSAESVYLVLIRIFKL